MPAMRHAEYTLILTKSLGEVAFLSVESEDFPSCWSETFVQYSCHNALLSAERLLTPNPEQRREEHLVCAGLTANISSSDQHLFLSPTSPLPSHSLLSFPVVAVGWEVGDRTLSLFLCLCPWLSVADTPQQAAELLGWWVLWRLQLCKGNNWAQCP